MKVEKRNNFRIITHSNLEIPCYFYGYFKSPGLTSYPDLFWVNDDYQLIKSKNLSDEQCLKIATNFFLLGKQNNLFQNCDYFIMMPLKTTSVSSLEKIILKLIVLIEKDLKTKVRLISDLFVVKSYRKFWENRLTIYQRKKAILNKIKIKQNYDHFFSNKKIIIIDDVVSTGVSIAEIALLLKKMNDNLDISALTYGSVYQWQEIYL